MRHGILSLVLASGWIFIPLFALWMGLCFGLVVDFEFHRDYHSGLTLWALCLAAWVGASQTGFTVWSNVGETPSSSWDLAPSALITGLALGPSYTYQFIATFAVLAGLIGIAEDKLGFSGDARGHDMIAAFLWTAVLYVLYYSCLFDGTGRYNPNWTGVFG